MTIKQELREFYKRQGTTGKALRAAMRYDLRSIRKQNAGWRHRWLPVPLVWASLNDINWGGMLEGPGYWLSRACGFPSDTYSDSNGPLRTIR